MNVNKGRFGSVMWIMVTCTETIVNAARFTILILYDCSGKALYSCAFLINTFAASYLNTQGLNNSCLKSPASTLVDLTFQSRALRSFSLNQLRNLSL